MIGVLVLEVKRYVELDLTNRNRTLTTIDCMPISDYKRKARAWVRCYILKAVFFVRSFEIAHREITSAPQLSHHQVSQFTILFRHACRQFLSRQVRVFVNIQH
jgi:hypothetical protein